MFNIYNVHGECDSNIEDGVLILIFVMSFFYRMATPQFPCAL